MKKFYVVALGAAVACGSVFTSCDNVSSNPTLKSEIDSISYAYGGAISTQLEMQLQQMGLVNDTARFAMMLKSEISAEQDATKKAALEKKFQTRLDSVAKANQRNITEFLKGLQEGVKAGEEQSAYYAGLSAGQRIGQQFGQLTDYIYEGDSIKPEINKSIFVAGLSAGAKKEKLAIEEPNIWFENKMKGVEEVKRAKQEAELAKQYAPQIAEGKKWFEENKAKDGVVALPNGIQYKIEKAGTGAKPSPSDVVSVNYKGTLLDGTQFDSSYDRKEPFKFTVSSGVIKGWSEILPLMPVGSKWTVYIPYDLAYGAADRGTIKPFSNLIFEIELLSIDTPAAAQPAAK